MKWALAILAWLCGAVMAAQKDAHLSSPAQRLVEADKSYRAMLYDILTAARLNDDRSTAADIESRLALTEKRTGQKDDWRKVVIAGSALLKRSSTELLVTSEGLSWRDLEHWADLGEVTVNGENWGNPRAERLLMNVGEVRKWQATGAVSVRKVQRGPGIIGFVLKTNTDEREKFTLTFLHR